MNSKILLQNRIKIVSGLIGICLASIASYHLFSYVSNLPKRITTYEGISIGMSMAEVKYILGYPDDVLHPAEDMSEGKGEKLLMQRYADKEDIRRSPKGVDGFYDWQYRLGPKRIDVEFDKSSLTVRSIGCYTDAKLFPVEPGTCAINNIQASDIEEVVLDKLGVPSSSVIENSTKILEYANYNMKIFLTRKVAYYIIVEDLR